MFLPWSAVDALESLKGLDDADPLAFVIREIPPDVRPYIGNAEKLADAQRLVDKLWAQSQAADADRADKVS